MHSDIVRLNRDLADDLFIESYATGSAAHDCQDLVIVPFAPAQTAAMQVESYTRHQGKVQPV